MYRIKSSSEKETMEIAAKISRYLAPGDILALRGELGAGKTTFIKGLAKGLGISGEVRSPSFVILNTYSGRIPLYHFDVYRLMEKDDLIQLGYEEYFYGNGVCVIEWAERIEKFLGGDYLDISMEFVENDDNSRRILIMPRGDRFKGMFKDIKLKDNHFKGI